MRTARASPSALFALPSPFWATAAGSPYFVTIRVRRYQQRARPLNRVVRNGVGTEGTDIDTSSSKEPLWATRMGRSRHKSLFFSVTLPPSHLVYQIWDSPEDKIHCTWLHQRAANSSCTVAGVGRWFHSGRTIKCTTLKSSRELATTLCASTCIHTHTWPLSSRHPWRKRREGRRETGHVHHCNCVARTHTCSSSGDLLRRERIDAHHSVAEEKSSRVPFCTSWRQRVAAL